MRKRKDLAILLAIYILAYAVGWLASLPFDHAIMKCFVFDTAATVVTFVFSVIFGNSSVYDAYWSVTPMVVSLCLFFGNRAFSPFQLLFLLAFNLWAVRLTANWLTVFTGFDYEDWRYRKYRSDTAGLLWPLVNFFGIHYFPTLVVFLGMLPLFEIAANPLGIQALPGILLLLCGVALEFFADRQMHAFLAGDDRGSVCRSGLWAYSRHPNYLGEITVWLGVFLTMLPFAPSKWYYVVGSLSVALLFNFVSIPLMETRQRSRRPDYAAYAESTSRLLLLPARK